MAKNTINDKSKQISIRIPHDAFEGMESVKLDGESNAGFIVTAMRGEIARRQAEGSGENPLFSSLDALALVEKIGVKAAEEIGQLVTVAREELQRRKAKEQE
ncbi:YlcI/YnfO family protein [Escherichia coli]|uniref:YlcI/YnfO family protein n=1 Tax=Escherichia coli TaxID=562 RepID=UPI000B7E1D4F|nr:YlcI/YnfO family protein [Escherichia coli]